MRSRRRVRRDSTVSFDGTDFELDQGFLSGRLVTVARCLADHCEPPWIEHEGKRLELHRVDPVRNARRRRAVVAERTPAPNPVAFDPARALLDRASGRGKAKKEEKQ